MNEPRSNGLQMNGAGKCVDMGMGGGKSPYDAGGQDMSKQSGGMNEPTLKGITPNEHVQRTVGSLGGAMNEPRVGLTEEGTTLLQQEIQFRKMWYCEKCQLWEYRNKPCPICNDRVVTLSSLQQQEEPHCGNCIDLKERGMGTCQTHTPRMGKIPAQTPPKIEPLGLSNRVINELPRVAMTAMREKIEELVSVVNQLASKKE